MSVEGVCVSLTYVQLDKDFFDYPPANMPPKEEWDWQEWNKV